MQICKSFGLTGKDTDRPITIPPCLPPATFSCAFAQAETWWETPVPSPAPAYLPKSCLFPQGPSWLPRGWALSEFLLQSHALGYFIAFCFQLSLMHLLLFILRRFSTPWGKCLGLKILNSIHFKLSGGSHTAKLHSKSVVRMHTQGYGTGNLGWATASAKAGRWEGE